MNSSSTMMKKLALATAIASIYTAVPTTVAYGAIELEEVVVTARKREESIQDVPVAVTAVTPEQFERAAIVSLEDATALTPGFTTQPSSSSPTSPALSMRGSTQTDQIVTADPSVGVYLDGVFIARTYGIGVDLLDLASVQVLKGPQGTLFGRNSTAGAMLLKTNDPELEELSGQVSLTAGDENSRHGFIVNVPVGEKFAVRAAYQKNDREDYITNAANATKTYDSKIGGYTNESSRIKARFTPNDSLDFILSYEEFEADISGPAREQTWLSGNLTGASSSDDTLSLSFDPRSYTDTQTLTFNATHSGDYGELKFTYSNREWRDLRENDYDGGDFATDPAIRANRRHGSWGRQQGDQDSYELQLNTSLFNDSVELVTGLTYFKEYANLYDYSQGLDLSVAAPLFGAGSAVSQDTESWGGYAQATISITDQSNLTIGLRHTKDEKSAFISGDPSSALFPVLPSWDFDAMVAAHASLLPYFGFAPPFVFGTVVAPTTLSPSDEWSSTDWLISLDNQITDEVLIYIKASTGFRAGGFNGRGVPAGSSATLSYDPEEVLEFEIGMKGDFMDGQLRWNTALYMNETTDKQISTIFGTSGGGTGSAIQNAGTAESQGFETEFTYLLHDNWSVSGSWSYIDFAITKMQAFDSFGDAYNLSDEYLPIAQFVPENEATLSLAYDQDFDNFTLSGTVTYHWIDEMAGNDKSVQSIADEIAPYGLTFADAESYVKSHTSDAYGTVNLNLTAADLDQRYSATLWVKNALDERAAQSGIGFIAGNAYQYATTTWTEPRTVGLTLKANF